MIVEPVMGTGGIIPPPADYFPKLQAICAEVDEIVGILVASFAEAAKDFATR